MPILLKLRLKATWTVRPDTKQLHGLACALFEGDATGHRGPQKPFAVTPLHPVPDSRVGEWHWRVAWLLDTTPPAWVLAVDTLRLGHVSCTVMESTQRRATHAALAAGPSATEVTVTFTSPTYFSQNGSETVTPDPRLIVGSWRRRWDASLPAGAPLAITDDEWTATHRLLTLSTFNLRTEPLDTGYGRDRLGFTGTATLRVPQTAPASSRRILGTLSRFAQYCGTGAQTTHGFGATTLTRRNA